MTHHFTLGELSGLKYLHSPNDIAAGLSIVAVPIMYDIKSYIRNVATCDNNGLLYGNMLFRVNCKVTIELTKVNCTGGGYDGLALKLREESAESQPFEVITRHFYIVHSYFGQIIRSVSLEYFPWPYSGSLKLENVTFEDSKEELTVSMIHGSTLIMGLYTLITILDHYRSAPHNIWHLLNFMGPMSLLIIKFQLYY